jgi:hypothetical protein
MEAAAKGDTEKMAASIVANAAQACRCAEWNLNTPLIAFQHRRRCVFRVCASKVSELQGRPTDASSTEPSEAALP